MTIIMGFVAQAWQYIRNGLPNPSLAEIAAWLVAVIGGLKLIEDYIIKKKSLGNWVYRGIKKGITFPFVLLNKIDKMEITISQIKDEVAINGGTKLLRDVVLESKERHQKNAKMLQEIMLRMRASYELDSEMKFMMDSTGGFDQPNKSFLSFFGFSEQDIKDREWQRHIDESDMKHVTPKLHWALRHKGVFEVECGITSNEDIKYRCRLTAIPMKNGDELLGFMGQIEIIE